MPSFVIADLALGSLAIVGSLWLRYIGGRQPASTSDDQVVRADLGSALRAWGVAAFLLGVLALAQMPGGFTLAIWSVLALGFGATGALIAGLRWWVEGWDLRRTTTAPDRLRVESETRELALIGTATGLASTYVLGLALHIMQPVHLGISLLGGTVGYALGLIIWTPRARIHRVTPSVPTEPTSGVAIRPPYRSRRRRRAGQSAVDALTGRARSGDHGPDEAGGERHDGKDGRRD